MRKLRRQAFGYCSLPLLAACVALGPMVTRAQGDAHPAYLNPNLPAEERAADLVGRMSLSEKASQLVNQSRAIPRLSVPAYDWWSEALHGVAVNGTTEFPEPIGLAATFDVPGIHEMATAIGVEARIKHAQAERAGHSNIFEGLDFWAPNVNIFRDPRWGRGQETYGEDPFLTARLAVASSPPPSTSPFTAVRSPPGTSPMWMSVATMSSTPTCRRFARPSSRAMPDR